MNKKTIKKLQAIVGEKYLTTAREDLMCYSYDGTGMEYMPSAVAFPGSAAEICSIMEIADHELFPVIPRGAGTGMTGGSLPVEGGLVLAMNRLNKILEIDTENQVAVVEPGVITGQFQAAVRKEGLFYSTYPAFLRFFFDELEYSRPPGLAATSLGRRVCRCPHPPTATTRVLRRSPISVVRPSSKE